MKVNEIGMIYDMAEVAPLVGAWIEREEKVREAFGGKVAPLVGAWIERYPPNSFNHLCFVAPLVGAWIEIIYRNHPFKR